MLSAEQRLDAFVNHLNYRHRKSSGQFNRFTDQELVRQANEFLNSTCWAQDDTPEGLVQRLRQRRTEKGVATRSRNATLRKQAEKAQAEAERQLNLF